MKKKIMFLAVALIATIGIASAQEPQNATNPEQQAQRACFVDADSNGICDKYEAGDCNVGRCDGSGKMQAMRDGSRRANGKGNIRNAGRGMRDGSVYANSGRRARYVDANNDGVCDNRAETATANNK